MPAKKILSKREVSKLIDEAIINEEAAIPIYASHIKAAMFWSGLPDKKQEKIRAGLEVLLKDSRGHVSLLKEVKKLHLKSKAKKRAK